MEVITIESQAYKELTKKINMIAKFVDLMQAKADDESEDGWVDTYEVCTFLKVSEKTLQRLRVAKVIAYSKIGGKIFFRISEIKRLMDENIIRRNEENYQDLIKNHRFHVEQRRYIKTDK